MVKHDSSLQRTRFHCSNGNESNGSELLHFMKLATNSYCADIASRGNLELGSECHNRRQTILRDTRFSTWGCLSVSLCGLPLHGWAIVAPICFHFTKTALTVDWGSSSRGRNLMNWLVGKVAPYDGAMLKVTELFSKAILLPMFVYGDCMDFIAKSTHLSTYFCIYRVFCNGM